MAGNFSSSGIVALTSVGTRPMTAEEIAEHKKLNPKSQKKTTRDGFGAGALTYIAEKNMERRLGRWLSNKQRSKETTWGNALEGVAFSRLGFEYELTSKTVLRHTEFDFWSGAPDGNKQDTVIDLKCPFTLKSFCTLVDPLYNGLEGMDAMNAIRENHTDGEKYYWELVSNSILSWSEYAELIVFVPYKSELQEIKLQAHGDPDAGWIYYAEESELPYLIDGGYYKNMNIIRFQVPEEDKKLLRELVIMGGEKLIKRM